MPKQGYVYILTNPNNTVLYTGVTSNLVRRLHQHKTKALPGFSAKYNCTKLVWFEQADEITSAIAREKQIKAGSRKKKENLINAVNPQWNDLTGSLYP